MKSTREANKCTGKIFRGGNFDRGMADVLRTLVVLLLCALCLGSCAREEESGGNGYELQVTGYGVQVKPLPAEAGFPVSGDTSGLQVTGYEDNGEGLTVNGEEEAGTVNGSYLAGSDDRQSRAGFMVHGSEDESSTVSRSMQESTETVAKTYGYFSENGASEKNQNRSSVSGVSAAKEDPQPSEISPQTSAINHHTSAINHHTSAINHHTSDLNHQPSDTLAAGAVAADPEEPKAEIILPRSFRLF